MSGFRKDFVWGTATASYQVEGAAFEGGKGLSIWDVYTGLGLCFEGDSGDVACDQYHRYKEDVQLMKRLGYKAHRFSIGWPRVFPEGTGKVNAEGLRYYQNFADELVANGIEPYVTLYHWDLPFALQLRGGWLNPDSPQWFADYAAEMARALPKVKHFITFNEPQCIVAFGYGSGTHAPGYKLSNEEQLIAVHNILLAHGRAVEAIRAVSKAEVGFAPTGCAHFPYTDSAEDLEAARQAFFALEDCHDEQLFFNMSAFCDPVFLGKYPDGLLERYGKYVKIKSGDMEIISAKLDFMGQNIYNGRPIRANGKGGWEKAPFGTGWSKTAAGWPVTPKSMYYAPKFIYERYGVPLYITENGMSAHDMGSEDGCVHDPNRIDFLKMYLRELRRAASDGVDLRGYFEWSFLDNFEWKQGYNERFGIVYVDYATQKRIPKDSAYWYQKVIAANGENL